MRIGKTDVIGIVLSKDFLQKNKKTITVKLFDFEHGEPASEQFLEFNLTTFEIKSIAKM